MENQTQLPSTNPLEQLLVRYPIIFQFLRFGVIGALNTSLDFLLFNFLSKHFGVTGGTSLALLNVAGFSAAVLQGYFWNRSWAFSADANGGLMKQFGQLMGIGLLGVVAFALAIGGANAGARPIFYLGVLAAFLLLQYSLWTAFGIGKNTSAQSTKQLFGPFLAVSLIGVAINSGIVGVFSSLVTLPVNPDLAKNIAKAAATGLSLIWNFIGYKLLVFKK